jgi:hypothetical protein
VLQLNKAVNKGGMNMSELTLQGIERKAYKLVINHCPPSLHIEKELELTKLTTTALLIGIDEQWITLQLENCYATAISKRIKQSIH